jgi:hypothetical protein
MQDALLCICLEEETACMQDVLKGTDGEFLCEAVSGLYREDASRTVKNGAMKVNMQRIGRILNNILQSMEDGCDNGKSQLKMSHEKLVGCSRST